MTVRTIDDIFRDFVIDGVPASGPFHPYKPDLRDTLKKLLEGLSTFPDNRVIRLNNANEGTANNIVVTASVAIPAAAYQVLYILNVTQENTGPVTVSGAINRALVTNTSAAISSGYLNPGMAVLCIDTGSELRMLSYGDMETLLDDVEAALAAAQAAQAAAEQARDEAVAAASDAVSQGNVPIYSTRNAVETLEIPAGITAFRTNGFASVGDGGEGFYVWVATEPTHIGKVQSADGAWWEISGDVIDPRQLGAVGDGVSNDALYVQAAINLGKMKSEVIFGVSSTIVLVAGSSPQFRVKWIGTVDSTVVRIPSGTGTTIRFCEVDGGNLANIGIEDLGAFSVIDNCHIHHVHSLNGQARGIAGYNAVGGGIYKDNHIHDIYAPGNGIVGDAVGPSRAIAIFYPAAITAGYKISNNVIHDLNGEEADAIHVLFISGTNYLSSAKTRIEGNRIWNSAKRCIKVQASDTIIDGNIVRLVGTEGVSVAAIDVQQSDRCSITNNDVYATGVAVWGITYVNSPTIVPEVFTAAGIVSGNRVITSGVDNNGAIYVRRNNQCKVTGNYVTNGRISVESCSAPYVADNVGLSTLASGSDGFINVRANSFNASIVNNEVSSGSVYCCVRTDASKSMIKGNVNRAVATANATCVFINTFNCVIMDNINFLLGSTAVRYQTGDATNQQLVVNNHQFTV